MSGRIDCSWVRPSEHGFLKRAEEWAERVQTRTRWELTDFLSPREQTLLESIANREDLSMSTYGGYPWAERKRVLIMPANWAPAPEDFQVATLRISPVGSERLTHGQLMGSVLGLGVDRRKIGDIIVDTDAVYVHVASELTGFLSTEWRKAGRAAIRLEAVEPEAVQWNEPAYEKSVVSVASLRVDAVVARACHWSREKAQTAVERGLVSLNFSDLSKPDETVAEGDMLSVRGFGRVKVLALVGKSRADRHQVEVGVLRSSRQ